MHVKDDQMRRPTLFICEPEHRSSFGLCEYLTAKGFAVDCISESDRAIDEILTLVPDVVLVDTQLPVVGGYEVCSTIRPHYEGLILLKGPDAGEPAQLLAFERGADDYIVEPASEALVAARICAHLDRCRRWRRGENDRQLREGDLVIDDARRRVALGNRHIELTTKQFEVLRYLVRHSGRVVSREELYKALYQEAYNGFDRAVDVFVSRIRHQLCDDAENPRYLKTIRGVGYLFTGGGIDDA